MTRKNIVNWLNGFGQKLPEFSETMDEAASVSGLEHPFARADNPAPSSFIRMLFQKSWNNRFPQTL